MPGIESDEERDAFHDAAEAFMDTISAGDLTVSYSAVEAGWCAGRDHAREQAAARVRDLEAARDGWKEAAGHFRHGRQLARQHEIALKQRLWAEHEARVRLANTMADILMDIAYDEDDVNQDYCNVCHRSLIEEDGHQSGCLYVAALAAVQDAARSDEPAAPVVFVPTPRGEPWVTIAGRTLPPICRACCGAYPDHAPKCRELEATAGDADEGEG